MTNSSIHRRTLASLALAGSLALTATAIGPVASFAQDGESVSVGTATDDLGTYLVGPEGLTLYYFAADTTPGVSVCEGDCLAAWPPLLVAEGQELEAGDGVSGWLAAAPRSDGTTQATYRGRPLYYWQGDSEPGQTTGHGVNDVWWVALEDGSMPGQEPAESPGPGASAEPAEPADLTLETTTTDLGTFLTGTDGLTTYFFAADTTPGVSVCEGDCLTAWPPVTVPEGGTVAGGEGVTGVIGTITGTDGSTQVTYDGRPLYYWQGDSEPGQTTGHGVNDVWWVADVSGQLPAG